MSRAATGDVVVTKPVNNIYTVLSRVFRRTECSADERAALNCPSFCRASGGKYLNSLKLCLRNAQ